MRTVYCRWEAFNKCMLNESAEMSHFSVSLLMWDINKFPHIELSLYSLKR